MTQPWATQLRTIPVNHKATDTQFRAPLQSQTLNNGCKLWGGGLVVPVLIVERGRRLNTGIHFSRSHSTKSQIAAPSWKDTKVVRRLETLWKGNEKNPQFINERLFKLLDDPYI
jgi:hypothetical protein